MCPEVQLTKPASDRVGGAMVARSTGQAHAECWCQGPATPPSWGDQVTKKAKTTAAS